MSHVQFPSGGDGSEEKLTLLVFSLFSWAWNVLRICAYINDFDLHVVVNTYSVGGGSMPS